MTHPWHDIPVGDDFPNVFRMIVEIPREETTKYELDPELGFLEVNRIMHPPVPYPCNYGFIPRTLDEDGDPLDALALMQNAADPLTVLWVRPVGVARMVDEDERDDKLICVHIDDPMYRAYETMDELPTYEVERLEWFFEDYKSSMQGEVKVEGLKGREEALSSLKRCRRTYQKQFEAQTAR